MARPKGPARFSKCVICSKEFIPNYRHFKIKTCSPECLRALGLINARKRWGKRLEERFYDKVMKGCSCWQWLGQTKENHYGVININGKMTFAHRVAYELAHGVIPPGLDVLHHCDNRGCVNPSHLFLGTAQDNAEDMVEKGRSCFGEKHWNTRLTSEEVERIRTEHKQGKPVKKLATEYNYTTSGIKNILYHQRWTRKTKKHNNEAPGAMEEVRQRPNCAKCGKWVGLGGDCHHNPGKGLGGTTAVYTANPEDSHHLEKICEDCHRKRHG